MRKINIVILILICLITASDLSARYKDIPVTRDLNPDRKYISYEEYLEQHPFRPTEYSEINRISSNQRDEGFLIIVESDLYPEITDAIATYQNDLANEGYNSFLVEFSGTIVFDMKIIMMLYYQEDNVRNVILIGDLPVAWFEMFEDWNNNGIWDPEENWVDFPIELYFSDIDGAWEDIDNNGIYDYHEGDKHPEIGIGRIKASNMSYLNSSEAELINSYFQRNHLYRNGFLQNPDIALAYIDDDWACWGPEYQDAMQFVYPETELVDEINQTTAEDYRTNRLTADYEFIQVHAHSGPDAHYFYENNGNNYNTVTNYQISYLNPTAYFYNLFACSNSRFTENNNMGGMYLLGNDYCLGTIGSTKTGSMLWFEDFYESLSLDENLGEALRQWWELSVDVGDDWMWQRAWFYGMAIQGDPSLKLTYEDNVVFVPDDYPTIQEAINAVENGDIVLVNPGTYVENINYNGKNITVASLYYTTQDTSYISQTIIDGNQDGSVVTFESGEDSTAVLTGFTITNGNSGYSLVGGGIYCNNSSPSLINITIIDNFADDGGGGICCAHYSNPSLVNVTITGNSSADWGGGIYCYHYSNPSLVNVIITGNSATNLGGGIRCEGSSPSLVNVTITDNSADVFGGGIYCCDYSDPSLVNVTITGNSAGYGGGGICCFFVSSPVLENVTIANNSVNISGGGIYCYYYSNPSLVNVTITSNSAEDGSGGIFCQANSSPSLINSIMWNDTPEEIYFSEVNDPNSITIAYSDIQGGEAGIITNNNGIVYWLEGNIYTDPLFVNPDDGDFHLQDTSPCIGAGIDEIEINGTWYYAPLFDIEGNPRPDPSGSMPDMGAYENPLGEPQVGIIENCILNIEDCNLFNFPNPFNPSTTIMFELNTEITEDTELVIYNVKGQKIRQYSIFPEQSQAPYGAGNNQSSIVWDGSDENNQPVSSGIYFYKLKAGKFSRTRKMILLK